MGVSGFLKISIKSVTTLVWLLFMCRVKYAVLIAVVHLFFSLFYFIIVFLIKLYKAVAYLNKICMEKNTSECKTVSNQLLFKREGKSATKIV